MFTCKGRCSLYSTILSTIKDSSAERMAEQVSNEDRMLNPLEVERNELGYQLEEVGKGRFLRVVHKPCQSSDVCVFFVHGGGGRAGQFKHQIKSFESKLNIVALDFLGHGDSPNPNDPTMYTAEKHLEDLEHIYTKYKCCWNIFISHCYGSIHVFNLLNQLQAKKTLNEVVGVLIMALGIKAPVSLGLVGKLPAFVLEWLRPMARSTSNAAIFSPQTDPELIRFENTISDGNRMYVMKVIGQDCSKQQLWEQWLTRGKQALLSANIPKALVCGDNDGLFSVDSCLEVKQLLEISDECFHVVKDVGHLAMLEKPEEVNQLIRDFFCSKIPCLKCNTKPSAECSESGSETPHKL